jgi:hypothetical protein
MLLKCNWADEMKNYETIEHAVFMGWKTVLCKVLEIAIFWI